MIVTASGMAFAHGSNDVANAIGPVAAIVGVATSGEVEPSRVFGRGKCANHAGTHPAGALERKGSPATIEFQRGSDDIDEVHRNQSVRL